MSRRFIGKVALVTGASRGLGRAIAMRLAAEGAFVAIGYKDGREGAEATLEALRVQGGDGCVSRFDVTDPRATEDAIRALHGERGRLDVVVANAGIAHDGYFAMGDPESFGSVLSVNVGGTANTCRSAARVMMTQRAGAIVTVSSVAGVAAAPGQASYAASKGGIIALTKALAAELASRGIRVNCVVPGLLNAGLALRLDHRVIAARRAQIALGRLGEAEEVAGAVAFLASSEAAYVVGHALVVDGGLSA